MPLPFLPEQKKMSTPAIPRHSDDEHQAGLMSAASDLLSALESKNIKGITAALQAAFEIMDASPHVEGEHLGDEE